MGQQLLGPLLGIVLRRVRQHIGDGVDKGIEKAVGGRLFLGNPLIEQFQIVKTIVQFIVPVPQLKGTHADGHRQHQAQRRPPPAQSPAAQKPQEYRAHNAKQNHLAEQGLQFYIVLSGNSHRRSQQRQILKHQIVVPEDHLIIIGHGGRMEQQRRQSKSRPGPIGKKKEKGHQQGYHQQIQRCQSGDGKITHQPFPHKVQRPDQQARTGEIQNAHRQAQQRESGQHPPPAGRRIRAARVQKRPEAFVCVNGFFHGVPPFGNLRKSTGGTASQYPRISIGTSIDGLETGDQNFTRSASQFLTWSMGTRTWSMVSRSRMVTQ